MQFQKTISGLFLFLVLPYTSAQTAYPYPDKPHSIDTIVQQVYYSVHGMHQKNVETTRQKGKIAVLINRLPGKKVSVNTMEAYVSNDFDDGKTESKQLAIFKSGKLSGTGILMTSYKDRAHDPDVMLWLPAMRKVRRFLAPNQADKWMGTVFTYGDVFLRKPDDETHELLSTDIFKGCIAVIKLEKEELTKRTKKMPEASCLHEGKPVYKIKSTTKFKDWWYDYHISDIDTETFAPYRTVYFKDGKQVKTIEIDWASLNKADPRMVYLNYVYGKDNLNEQESMLIIPSETVTFNTNRPAKFWSEKTLRKIKR